MTFIAVKAEGNPPNSFLPTILWVEIKLALKMKIIRYELSL